MDRVKELIREWKEKGIPEDLIERDLKLEWMEKKANSLIGMRRIGKTYAVFQFIKQLKAKNAFYLNLEDDRIINPNLKHLTDLIPLIKENFDLDKGKIYLFIDEIQNVKGWEKWARRMAEDLEVNLFVLGSSSKLSGREIATSLRGRNLTNYFFPLNLKEFLKFRDFKSDLRNLTFSSERFQFKKLFKEYLTYGGFPEVVLTKEENKKLKLLREYFETILSRDLIERFRIANQTAFEIFMKFIINNFSRYLSFSKTEKWMNSMGIKVSKATLIEYFNYIRQAYFCYDVEIFSYKIKDRLQYPRKIYIADLGFVTALAKKSSSDFGWFYENTVALELIKQTMKNPSKEIFYWRSKKQEVDFVLKQGQQIEQLIQVCYIFDDEKTKHREIDSLINASKELKCRNLLIITKDYEAEEKHCNKNIKFIPLWKWLLK